MFIEKLVLENFQCFGPGCAEVALGPELTALVGANGSGKTAACLALLRLFGVSTQERAIRADDFHVPADEVQAPATRALTIEAILAFPELDEDEAEDTDDEVPAGSRAVPGLFERMAATPEGEALKVRIILRAVWEDDGTVEGAITEKRMFVLTLDPDFDDEVDSDKWTELTAAERSRIQMIYIPATRDGARHVAAFLRGRLWRAAQWSTDLRDELAGSAKAVADRFAAEPAVAAVETALTARWQELHDSDLHASPRFRLLDDDITQLVRGSELVFEPSHTGRARPARLLSDGQRSLLHLALTTATLDVEAALVEGRHGAEFQLSTGHLPDLTLIAVEEPENSLSPFFLSRIVAQLQGVSRSTRAQSVISSHSASVLTRVEPEDIRYFRLDTDEGAAEVHEITLPDEGSDAGKYIREAVRAHPELYFAKFVILGEGDTEEIVIPRIAKAQDVGLDPSFVAMVPLGGRHTNHMWKLLNDLKVPHATLLDLDYGRAGGGAGRLRDACKRLADAGLKPLRGLPGFASADDITDDLTPDQLRPVTRRLERHGVFFASPLDLDYSMLRKYPTAYRDLDAGERGPAAGAAAIAVLGRDRTHPEYWALRGRPERLRWYRYLFLTRSKPSTHLRALSRLTDAELAQAPTVITSLVRYVRRKAGL
ncbi:MAG TPA: AAA family ATPase [Micromonosporaceae bacterium]